MADAAAKLYEGQPGTSDGVLFTDAGNGTILRGIHICNTTASAATIELGLNAGGTLDVANAFLWDFALGPNGTYDWSGFQVLDAGETINALQDTSGALTVTISGVAQ